MFRPTWDEYFLLLAKLAATRSTCLGQSVGAVLVRDKFVIATGYNGVPSGCAHCTDLGYCYEGILRCTESNRPSRAIHAEANAIAQAAKHGITTDGATIYTTLEPCLSCLKLIIASGIKEVVYLEGLGNNNFFPDSAIHIRKAHLSPDALRFAIEGMGAGV